MKEFKGTKGKWAAETSGGKGSWIGNENGWAALSCGNTHEESEANALLISKAPELLQLAQMHVDKLDLSNLEFYEKYGFNVSELTDKTRELIKSATDLT